MAHRLYPDTGAPVTTALLPRPFPQANLVLHGTGEVAPLPVYTHDTPEDGHPFVMSCWTVPKEVALHLLAGGRLWLCVRGTTHPPLSLVAGEMFAPDIEGIDVREAFQDVKANLARMASDTRVIDLGHQLGSADLDRPEMCAGALVQLQWMIDAVHAAEAATGTRPAPDATYPERITALARSHDGL